MSYMVRLTKEEEKALDEQCVVLNKALIKANNIPIRKSELVHKILEKTIKKTAVSETGEIKIKGMREL